MAELDNFKKVWKFEGQRGEQTRSRYEAILFSIWRNHHTFEDLGGFQISAIIDKKTGKRDRTFYRVVDMAVKAGLLTVAKNYSVGNHTRIYNKNKELFNQVFSVAYDNWKNGLINSNAAITGDDKNSVNEKADCLDIVMHSKLDQINNFDIEKWANLDVNTALKLKEKEIDILNYDIYKLYDLKKTMLPHYYNLMLQLNNAAIDDRFKYTSFFYFDDKGLPTGRPYSFFTGTMNDKKKHKKEDDRMSRKAFLTEIGIADYEEIYDIKSQVPRVNYLFHTGQWKPDSYDFYEEILKNTEAYKNGYEVILRDTKKIKKWSGSDLTDEEIALYYHDDDFMKGIFMRIFFRENSSPKNTFKFYRNKFLKRKQMDKIFYDNDLNYPTIKESQWLDYYSATEKIVMPSIGNLIFWFTFFLETEVKIELLNRGKKVYSVHDGFYYQEKYKDETKAEIIQILNIKAVEIYEKYMKPLHRKREIIAGRVVDPVGSYYRKKSRSIIKKKGNSMSENR